MPKVAKTNYNGEVIFAVERFMIRRGYAPICNPDSSVKAWQKKGDHKADRIGTREAELMMVNFTMRQREKRYTKAVNKRKDWE